MPKIKKKLMTIDDLRMFCINEGLYNFNASNNGYPLRVQVPGVFALQESDEFTLYANIKICHTGRNRNGSDLKDKAAKHCMKTLAYKPLLANFTDVNGEWDFTSHDFYVETDEDGNIVTDENGERIYHYEEKQIGCFTADKPYMEYDEKYGHDYIYGRVAIPRQYTKASEIIERKNGTKVSVELEILEMSFDAKRNVLNLDDAVIVGCTCLGVDPDTGNEIGEGMVDSHISLESFSEDNNSMFTTELLNELREFNKNFATINDNSKEGGKGVSKFEELLQQYNVTAEDVTFDYEGLTDEELETKFSEIFGEDATEETPSEEGEETVENTEDTEDTTEGEEESDTEDDSEEADEDSEETDENDTEESGDSENTDSSETYSITLPDGTVKEFSLSLGEIETALYNLVNDTYSEMDNDYYGIDVYPDDSKVVMIGWFSGQAYRQSYKRKKDNFTLDGERVAVHSIWVSDDEQKVLDDSKANFEATEQRLAEVEEKLAKYEAEPEKVELLNSKDFASIAETEEYKELAKEEAHFDLTKDELEGKLNDIILKYAKAGMNFSAEKDSKSTISIRPIPSFKPTGTKGRYGGIFSKNN